MALFDRSGQNIEKLKDKNDLEGIIRLLAHPDEAVRTGAARELAAMGVPAVAGILKVFEGLDEEERIRYARSLVAPGIPSIPFILQIIVRASPDARIPLANALSRHGTAVFEVLAAGTRNASHRVRIGSAAALGSMGKEAIGPLRALLTDPEPAVRREAALSLARLGWEPDAAPERAYLLFLREEWEDLVRMKNHAVPVLVRGTADPVPETRRNAVRALGKIRHPPTLPTLLGALDDRVLEVRLSAIEAISEMKDPRSIPPLIGLISDEYPQIRMEAAWALDRIGWIPSDDHQRVALFIAKEQWNEVLKLGRCAIPPLIRALQEDHSSVRSGAIETLRKMGKPAYHALMKAATSPDRTMAKAAAAALQTIKTRNDEESVRVPADDDGRRFSRELQEGLEARKRFDRLRAPSKARPRHIPADAPPVSPREGLLPDRGCSGDEQLRKEAIAENERRVMAGFRASGAGTERGRIPGPDTAPQDQGDPTEFRRVLAENERAAVEGFRKAGYEKENPKAPAASGACGQEPASSGTDNPSGVVPGATLPETNGMPSPRVSPAEHGSGDSPQEVSPLDRLLRALQDPDDAVRAAAIESLRQMGEPAVDGLVRALGDSNHLVRIAAAEALGAMGGRKALGALLTLLKDADEDVRLAVIRALGLLCDPLAIPFLIGLFADDSYAIRIAAAHALVEFGDPALVHLLSALNDKNASVRITAAGALGKLVHVQSIPTLIEHLGDEVSEVRFAVAQALGEIGLPAIQTLVWVLKKGTKVERLTALDALGRILDEEAREGIEFALTDPDPDVREKAERALRKHEVLDVWRKAWFERLRQEESVSPAAGAIELIDEKIFEVHGAAEIDNLITALRDQRGTSQMAAAMRLIMMGRPAVEGLIRAMKDEDPTIQMAAAEVLGEMRDVAVEPLMDAMQDDDVFIRIVAARNLGKIGNEQSLETLVAALQGDADFRVRAVVAEALGYMGDDRTIGPLTDALRDRDEEVQMAAAKSLGYIGDRRAIEPLIGALCDIDERVQRVALEALRDPDGSVRDHLLAALREGEKQYRRGVADALDRIGWEAETAEDRACYLIARDRWAEIERVGPPAIGPLKDEFRDPDVAVRLAALKAISRIGGDASVTPLISALGDADVTVRQRAERSLIGMGAGVQAAIQGALQEGDAPATPALRRILGAIGTPDAAPLIDETDPFRAG